MGCEKEVNSAATWFAEQLFEPNEQREIFLNRLKVRASARPLHAWERFLAARGGGLKRRLTSPPPRRTC